MDIGRRQALQLLAGGALAGALGACSPPDEEIIPYAHAPEGIVAGEPRRYATTLQLSGYARGAVGITIDGRPIKIEGNPRHPFSAGATDVFSEAEVLSLYDTDRSRSVLSEGSSVGRDAFWAAWSRAVDGVTGSGMALVTGRIVSVGELARIAAWQRRFPEARWYRYEPVNDDAAREGARLAFGRVVNAQVRWREADVVLSLDADPLGHGPDQLRIARDYADRRRARPHPRLHVVEPHWTLTGAAADFRLGLAPRSVPEVARLVVRALGGDIGDPQLDAETGRFAERAAADLQAAHGRAMVMAGERQDPALHAVCHWLNDQLAAPVSCFASDDPVEGDHAAELRQLASDLHDRRISTIVIADANPVYDAPDAWNLADALRQVSFSVHLGLYRDETAECCRWHLPLTHVLESWGDGRAPDGTSSFTQPLIRRLHESQTRAEFLAALTGETVRSAYELVRGSWRAQAPADFDTWWRTALHDGIVAGSRSAALTLSPRALPDLPRASSAAGLTLALSPDPAVWDGRFANNAWLQECPNPFSKQVWGNAVELAAADAARLGLSTPGTVEITVGNRRVRSTATIMPGQSPGVIAARWGHGRWRAGRIGNGIGTRFAGLGERPLAGFLEGATLVVSAESLELRSTQGHTRLAGAAEELFPTATPAELGKPSSAAPAPPSFLGEPARGEYAWAMVVDADACIGCNACVVACQAENNVPVVGPEEITEGRDMHWLRVDAYALAGGTRRGFQPVPCMHCELAPCEPVCPVEASVHDHQGLNVQVYNRCIGTRFCEANCPYKVRRFNWFAYAGPQAYAGQGPALQAQHNPDVSVRGRGVMEKCNYCLQRIVRARRAAEKRDAMVEDGGVVTACQAACPTRAIHFGDLNLAGSDVARLRQSPRHYVLLAELNTRPRTTYLKRVYETDESK